MDQHPAFGPVTISYAARSPDIVSRLILWSAPAQAARLGATPEAGVANSLMERDWEFPTEVTARVRYGWDSDRASPYADLIRRSTTASELLASHAAVSQHAASSLLSEVSVPTLVVPVENPRLNPDDARTTAAGIADARLVAGNSGRMRAL